MKPEITIPKHDLNVIIKNIQAEKNFPPYNAPCTFRSAGRCPDQNDMVPGCNTCIHVDSTQDILTGKIGEPSSDESLSLINVIQSTWIVIYSGLRKTVTLTHSGASGGEVTLDIK